VLLPLLSYSYRHSSGQQSFPTRRSSDLFACKKPGTHEWHITAASGRWQDGAAVCSSETGGEYRFSVPTNGYDNQRLVEAKSYLGVGNVWLNYSDRLNEGQWLPGNPF